MGDGKLDVERVIGMMEVEGGERAVQRGVHVQFAGWIKGEFREDVERVVTDSVPGDKRDKYYLSALLQARLARGIAALPDVGSHSRVLTGALDYVAESMHKRGGRALRDFQILFVGAMGLVTLHRALVMTDPGEFSRLKLSMYVANAGLDVNHGVDLNINRGNKGLWWVQLKVVSGDRFLVEDLDEVNSVPKDDSSDLVSARTVRSMRSAADEHAEQDMKRPRLMFVGVPPYNGRNVAGSVLGVPTSGIDRFSKQLSNIGFI